MDSKTSRPLAASRMDTLSTAIPVLRSLPPGSDPLRSLGSANGYPNVFCDGDGKDRILRGVAIYSGAPRLAELAARIGFETIWIEMEHGPTDFALAEHLCMAVEAGGGIPTVRVCDGQRTNVLRALEIGARIVVIPMVNTPEQARQIVEFGKFPPLGARGYNTRSRGVNYGLGVKEKIFPNANACTHLFAQIESTEAVKNLDAICSVDGLSGVFIGPGDLSSSIGQPGQLEDPRMISLVTDCVRRARAAGKHAGILAPQGRLMEAAVDAGCNLIFFGGDISDLSVHWPRLLQSLPAKLSRG